ncbi:Protein STB6 [Grifola frondosa]|uniref:Protein STB6 n=1 Tax=Grifola frondosa TaxID=5627 RepID=A0A1C7M0J7_GRIFR|nr:Protein STB6 [Grifola frondosa]
MYPSLIHIPNSSTNVASQRRLLMPTVRSPKPFIAPSPRLLPKSSPSKLGRSRAGSVGVTGSPDVGDRSSSPLNVDWIGGGRKFEVVEEQIELEGFQIYAVEKWVVERKRPVIVLTVYTGDPQHKITVTALTPQPSLTLLEMQLEWEKAIHDLRRDGARPKETDKGILMVTSLANFRSDYTIVHIPRGNFIDVREQLYTNISLLRMGCGGRSALTLEEPSDATKDRFIAMYHVADKTPARSCALFNATVLELVRLIQAALSIFGMFDICSEERNGLLCDVTCEGIQRWVLEIGEPCMKVEPMERVADPTVVAALFSLILSTRGQLHALGQVVPKDPFLDPSTFVRSLASFHASKPHYAHSQSLSLPSTTQSSTLASPSVPPVATAATSSSSSSSPPTVFLTKPLIASIQAAYEKVRQSESYKVHRVLKNKLDDLATDLRTHGVDTAGGTGVGCTTADLAAFVKALIGSKDAPQSLRYLWTGRPGQVGKKRREDVWSDTEREREEREKDKEKCERDGEKEGEREKDDRGGRSADEEGEYGGMAWSGRMQRKIENWAVLGRGKKLSVDFGTLGKAFAGTSPETAPKDGTSEQPSMVPSVVVSRDPGEEEEILSSGQVSPVSDSQNPFMLGVGSFASADHSASEHSDYVRRVTEFNHRRPSSTSHYQPRITSWSDPTTGRAFMEKGSSKAKRVGTSLERVDSLSAEDEDSASTIYRKERSHRQVLASQNRRHSFDSVSDLEDAPILPLERMRLDVELCGQLLVMRRREAHLANVLVCLDALAAALSDRNARLRQNHETSRGGLAELEERTRELPELEELRTNAEALTQDTNALAYEFAQFLVADLWHMAAQPRQRVLALRERVFGTGRRLPQGVRGAHGPFSRVQWTLDGTERLVDGLGRTESEAEEEEGLPRLADVNEEMYEDVDAVEHQTLKPTWLLRFFNYWGSKWGTGQGTPKKDRSKERDEDKEDGSESAASTSVSQANPRTQALLRTNTT